MENQNQIPTIEDSIKQLAETAQNYGPSADVLNEIRGKKLLCLIGASAVGKSTVMRELVTNHGFSEVLSFVTRPKRDENDRYNFIDKTPENLQTLNLDAKNGRMVNLFFHPNTGDVYGTYPKDYEKSPCVLGATSASYEKINKLPLEATPVAIITDPEVWKKRIAERTDLTPEGIKIRAIEAATSLEWCLQENGVLFVNNSGSLANTVESIQNILAGTPTNQSECKEIAEKMLKVAISLQ